MKLRLTVKGVWSFVEPKADITPLEAANLALFMVVAAGGINTVKTREEFLEKHNLFRHFTPEE